MDYKKDDCSKTISFGRITGSSTDVETVIFDYDRYELGNSKRCFPSVKKLIINENVEWIKVPNSMFPNVRTIISKSTQFRSGNVLIHESFWSRPTLLNVFGVEPDETIDLVGVQVIDSLALRGCKTIHFINTESVRFIEANSVRLSIFEDSEIERMILEKRYHEGVIMAGTILLAVNPDADEIEVPRNTTYIFPTVDFTKISVLSYMILGLFRLLSLNFKHLSFLMMINRVIFQEMRCMILLQKILRYYQVVNCIVRLMAFCTQKTCIH